MNPIDPVAADPSAQASFHPFRTAVFRGLAVLMPPLLTIVIFLWIGGTVEQYVLVPLQEGATKAIVWTTADIRTAAQLPAEERGKLNPVVNGVRYQRLQDKTYVPVEPVYALVLENVGEEGIPRTGGGVYARYVELRYLKPLVVVPCFVVGFVLILYLLGKFIAVRLGRMFWEMIEGGIRRVPVVSNVYTSVKQVSDFLLNQRDLEYSRVVAVQWPREGIWSLGFVTGDGMKAIEELAGEPLLTVLVCTSPMPMTGFTCTVRKSEAVDLNISIDQAFQFIISCGVVVPAKQMRTLQAKQNGGQLVGVGQTTDEQTE